jgi:hypothetical protein
MATRQSRAWRSATGGEPAQSGAISTRTKKPVVKNASRGLLDWTPAAKERRIFVRGNLAPHKKKAKTRE